MMFPKIKTHFDESNFSQLILTIIWTCAFSAIMVLPIYGLFIKAFQNSLGEFIGFKNYIYYFSTPSLLQSITNTLTVSSITAIVSTTLGFCFAFALMRTNIKFKHFFKYAALIPLFMPTVLHGIGLITLFGKQGIVTSWGIEVEIYGKIGIILSEIIYTFPQAFLMFYITLNYVDGWLYEAADTMGCSVIRKFLKITVPEIKYTLISSIFVCFTLAFTDFGAPKVLGGTYNVLAIDLYKQIAGQFNFNMGAVVSTLFLIPAVMSLIADRLVSKKSSTSIGSKAKALRIKGNKWRDAIFFTLCSLIVIFFLSIICALTVNALTTYYPYNMGITFEHFKFSQSTGGIKSFFNSINMSILTAIFGTIFVFIYAYLIEKGKGLYRLKKIGKFLSVLPIALPGMVIGISFIFFFNSKTNPLNFVYGTVIILVLANILHFYAVPYVTATSALRKLDKEFESVSESMRIPMWKVFLKVTVPMSLPAILEIFIYYFINAMVTVSAVVFLYSANFKIASIAITHMEDAGDIAQAAAMGLLIFISNLLIRGAYEITLNYIKNQIKKKEEIKTYD